ncbi:MAG: glycerol-3-phosphate acyltransferase, partial [Halioglobus sp.]|nr:glycerol-3-phosphate acyltransferase [Halioglobus sp.]
MGVELADKYRQSNPWPAREGQRVLFVLDTRNSFEQDLLKQWIHHHRASGSEEFEAPQVCLKLGDDRRAVDSDQLLIALALPADTLVAPLRVAWLPSQEDIDSGPRLRNLLFGDPRHPGASRARKIFNTSPERMHLIAGAPDSVANLRQRFELHHNIDQADAQRDFAEFVGRQAALVLDIAERRLQGGRYKVPRHVAASLMSSPAFNEAVAELAQQSGKPKHDLMAEASGYMTEMVSRPSTFWLDFYAKFNKFCLGLGYEEQIVYDQAAVEKMRQMVRDNPA